MNFKDSKFLLHKVEVPQMAKSAGNYITFESSLIRKTDQDIVKLLDPNPVSSVPPEYANFIKDAYASMPAFPFAVKDPHFVFLYQFWISTLSGSASVVPIFTVRSPLEAAQSLADRGWVKSVTDGLTLWLTYNKAILAFTQTGAEGYLISYNKDTFQSSLATLFGKIGILMNSDYVGKMLNFSSPKQLDQSALDSHPSKADILSVYSQLMAACL